MSEPYPSEGGLSAWKRPPINESQLINSRGPAYFGIGKSRRLCYTHMYVPDGGYCNAKHPRNYRGSEYMAILREHLIDKVPISDVCERMYMSEAVVCPECNANYGAEAALRAATISWPDLHWVYFCCPACGRHTHIELRDGLIATIRVLGSPGPNWERIRVVAVDSLRVQADTGFLHCWINDVHYEFPART